jgi:hypothetical protein
MTHKGSRATAQSLFTLAVDVGDWSAYRSCRFIPGNKLNTIPNTILIFSTSSEMYFILLS